MSTLTLQSCYRPGQLLLCKSTALSVRLNARSNYLYARSKGAKYVYFKIEAPVSWMNQRVTAS